MKKIMVGLLASTYLLFSTADAATIRGSPSCGGWIKAKEEKDWQVTANLSWVVGFLSGMSLSEGSSGMANIDNASISLWIDNYCRSNPLAKVSDAAEKLFDEMKAKELKKR